MEVSIAQLTGVDVVHLSLGGLKLASGRHYEKVQFLRSSVVLSESEIGLPPQIMSGPILRNATKFV